MGFILLIVFILTIFRTWKQSPLYGRFTTRANCITYSAAPARGLYPYNVRKHTHTMPMMLFCVFTCIFANVLITHA